MERLDCDESRNILFVVTEKNKENGPGRSFWW